MNFSEIVPAVSYEISENCAGIPCLGVYLGISLESFFEIHEKTPPRVSSGIIPKTLAYFFFQGFHLESIQKFIRKKLQEFRREFLYAFYHKFLQKTS